MTTSPLAAKIAPLHLLVLKNFPVFEQLQLEEALLRADERNWCLINIGSPPAIVMGISGKPELLVDSARMDQCPVPLIRRFSGGGTVFVDHDTYFVTWICNSSCSGVQCCPQKIHAWTEKFYQSAFPALDIKLRENDYVIGDRKFGGNAQYLRKQRWLHHSSLLWDYDQENMRYLLMPAKTPQYRQQRKHGEFLCRLRDFLPCQRNFEDQLLKSLKGFFDVQEIEFRAVQALLTQDHRKATRLIKKDC